MPHQPGPFALLQVLFVSLLCFLVFSSNPAFAQTQQNDGSSLCDLFNTMAPASKTALTGWCLGTALQLQQPLLWMSLVYASIMALALVLLALAAMNSGAPSHRAA
jgi:hypothetical protein